jgi:hypothetical protein
MTDDRRQKTDDRKQMTGNSELEERSTNCMPFLRSDFGLQVPIFHYTTV